MAAMRARQAYKLLLWARLGPSSAAPDALRGAVPAAECPPLPRVVYRPNSTSALAEARIEAAAAVQQKEEASRLGDLLQQRWQSASLDARNQVRTVEQVEDGTTKLVSAAASTPSSASDSSREGEDQEPADSLKGTSRRKQGQKSKAAEQPRSENVAEAGSAVTRERRIELLAQLGLTEEDLAKKRRLSATVAKALKAGHFEENMKALRSYGFTDYDLQRLVRTSKEAFSRDPSTVAAVLAYFAGFHLSERRFPEFCVLSKCLSFDLVKSIMPKVEQLNSIGAGGAEWLLNKKPQLLHWSKATLRQNASQLAAWVGPAEARELIGSHPTVILCSAGKFQKNGQIIREAIGDDLFPGFICKNPRIMNSPPECLQALIRTVQPRLRFTAEEWAQFLGQAPWVNQMNPSRAFKFLLSVFGERDLRSMALRVPSVFTTSADTLATSLQACEAAAPGEAKALILKNPHLLCLNWAERVEPVLSYLESRCGVDPKLVLRKRTAPRSLDGWVKPRVEFLLEQGYHIVASAADAAAEGAAAAELKDGASAGKSMVPIHPVLDMGLKRFQKRFPEYSGKVELEFRRAAKDMVNRKVLPETSGEWSDRVLSD